MKPDKLIARIETLIERIERSELVTRRALSFVLDTDEIIEMDKAWAEEKRTRHYRPDEIIKYGELVRKAIWYDRKADKKNCDHHALRNKSEDITENALEIYSEIVHKDIGLKIWFDREPADGSIDANDLPRPIWWKRHYGYQDAVTPFYSLNDIKLEALYKKLSLLKNDQPTIEEIHQTITPKKKKSNINTSDWSF